MDNKELIKIAIDARDTAYAPYSHWKVGAALLCKDGTVYKGCNIENSAFSSTNCAERTAIFKAISEGHYDLSKIAIVGGDEEKGLTGFCTPCGVCRQVMSEFCDPDSFTIICAKSIDDYKEYTLRDLLPETNFIANNEGYGFKQ